MNNQISRRALLAGSAGAALMAARPAAAEEFPVLTDISLSDDEMLQLFIKLRYSLDDRVTIGWVDAVNYGFIEGNTYPLYRLLAATWQRVWRAENGTYTWRSIEIAFFLSMQTGEQLQTLTMPVTGKTVPVPLYRAGPSQSEVQARYDRSREFKMNRETRSGDSFFVAGRSISSGALSQPQRHQDDFYLRQDLNTRVLTGDDARPSFFYREWTVTRGSWRALQDRGQVMVPCELTYAAATAWRPWMEMEQVPGHTLQSGVGGRVDTFSALPLALQGLAARHHPDLAKDPAEVLGLPE